MEQPIYLLFKQKVHFAVVLSRVLVSLLSFPLSLPSCGVTIPTRLKFTTSPKAAPSFHVLQNNQASGVCLSFFICFFCMLVKLRHMTTNKALRRVASFTLDEFDLADFDQSLASSGTDANPVVVLSSSPETFAVSQRKRDLSPVHNPFLLKRNRLDLARVEYPDLKALVNASIETPKKPQGKPSELPDSRIELLTQRPNVLKTPPRNNVKTVQAITLSSEQTRVVELAKHGVSLFYTGSAGTGKSLLLRSLIKALRAQHPPDTVAVTASTGLAACNIGGQTLHSFAGIGLGQGSVDDLCKKVRRSRKHRTRWEKTKVLVIDEISMINGELLDKLNAIAKKLRKNTKPFGGIQLVVCGDFFQLPPVSSRDSEVSFAFESSSWKECVTCTLVLKKVFRQQGDSDFVDMLNEIRLGAVSEKTCVKFHSLSRPLRDDNGIVAAELYPTKREVDDANRRRLRSIPSPSIVYRANDTGSIADDAVRAKMLDSLMVPALLELKLDSQVMLVKNMDQTLVNGSLGKVIAFVDPATFNVANAMDEMSLEEMEAAVEAGTTAATGDSKESSDPLKGSVFDFLGDLVKNTPEGTKLREDFDRKVELLRQLDAAKSQARLPLVRFIQPDGSTREVLVQTETFEMADENDVPIISRTQLPLILAWSLSIHKAQGQTLSKVKIDLRRAFENGQAYVALSRATTRRGLQVLNFHPAKVKAHSKVIDFYHSLVEVDQAIEQLNEERRPIDEMDEMDGRRQYDESYDEEEFAYRINQQREAAK
ncbi:unnamed protein product [Kuraishia capsulata CBS 1993]|uniref:ATP-dependent DNA helicase PIF1 n=1 Tax=Kuraishia capsulata CBS 1993 TaxID=1382522 RepID=W6MNR6_9ASCO|nr:uncharacterized protein KUCA_T00004296001 [Kuraishia capsulata CBS 1993]CDK28314.1 unnamed protein product [Kuraishia capsulata CBS 1993]